MKTLIGAGLLAGLAGCASTAPRQAISPELLQTMHEVQIVVLLDQDLLEADVQEPDYDAAPDLITVFRMRSDYKAQLQAAANEMRPLVAQLRLDTAKVGLADDVRKTLVSSGIKVDSLQTQLYDGSAHEESSWENRLADSPRGSALVVLVPVLRLSRDGRVVSLGMRVVVFARDSNRLAALKDLEVASPPIIGTDPVAAWSASSGQAFFEWIDAGGAQLGDQVAALFHTDQK